MFYIFRYFLFKLCTFSFDFFHFKLVFCIQIYKFFYFFHGILLTENLITREKKCLEKMLKKKTLKTIRKDSNKMTLKIYNTLHREKQEFKPMEEKNVRMYICGPNKI